MERQRFEDSWKEAFKEAEVNPSENLWTNIELDLEKAEGKRMKKRVLYFKLLAAASVAFAMTFAAAGYFYMNTQQAQLAVNSTGDKSSSQDSPKDSRENRLTEEATHAASVVSNESTSSSDQVVDKEVTESSTEHHVGDDKVHAIASDSKEQSPSSTRTQSSSALEKVEKTASASMPQKREQVNRVASRSDNKNNSAVHNERMFDSSNDVAKSDKVKTEKLAVSEPLVSAESEPNEDRLFANAKLPELVHVRKPAFHHVEPQATEVDPVKAMMDRLAAEEEKYASSKKTREDKRSKKGTERIWTSVGLAAGSFNTVVANASASPSINSNFATSSSGHLNMSSDATSSISDNIVHEQSNASGVSYAVGLSLGGKLSERWVLQGGVNYLTQSSDYTANAVIGSSDLRSFKVGSITELSNAGKSSHLVNTASYNVNSSLSFLSMPLQAGYLIINRDFGLQLNAGVSTDLFLQNKLTPDGGTWQEITQDAEDTDGQTQYQSVNMQGLEERTESAGENSPYRTVNFSGLVSTELSYRFGQHYRVAINPGIRYPFSSVYKSEIGVEAMPLTFDVGLKFRYIFN